MEGKDSPQHVIENFQRRQQTLPFIIGGVAILLIMIGVIILIVWLAGPNRPALSFLASATPTPTETYTPTPTVPTATPTETSTLTPTETATSTPTASGPFEYVVLANDNCWEISNKFKVDLAVLQALNNFGNGCSIAPGQKILIPAPGQTLPTETPLPSDTVRGTKIEYYIKLGDTLASIASKFNADYEALLKDNLITDANKILVGQKLVIKVNMVTPTKTVAPSATPAPKTPVPMGTQPTGPTATKAVPLIKIPTATP